MDRPEDLPESGRRSPMAPGARLDASLASIREMRIERNARHPSGAQKSRFSLHDAVAPLEDQRVTFPPMTALHAARSLATPLDHQDPLTNFCRSRLARKVSGSSPQTSILPAIHLRQPHMNPDRTNPDRPDRNLHRDPALPLRGGRRVATTDIRPENSCNRKTMPRMSVSSRHRGRPPARRGPERRPEHA